ncbi:MAG: hypothetical protein M1821_003072 [Bathelium mastoideum]|nr:MAG: hypothetical protein M1821_003072 [Bathelium mastoideum]
MKTQCGNPARAIELYCDRSNIEADHSTIYEDMTKSLFQRVNKMTKNLEFSIMVDHIYELSAITRNQMPLIAENMRQHINEVDVKKLLNSGLQWIRENPTKATKYTMWAGYITVTIYPQLVTGPVLNTVGFSLQGPRAHSIAAFAQSKLTRVAAKSVFAHLQSAKMGGYGVTAVNIWTRAGTTVSGLMSFLNSNLWEEEAGAKEVKDEDEDVEEIERRPVQVREQDVPRHVLDAIRNQGNIRGVSLISGLVFVCPWLLTGPLLGLLGFGALGPVAGSIAAWLQSVISPVAGGSLFAILQSAGMGGVGALVVNGVAAAAGAIGVAITAIFDFFHHRRE